MQFAFKTCEAVSSICYLICRAAAAVMLSGQIADGFTTIFAGELVSPKLNIALWDIVFILLLVY